MGSGDHLLGGETEVSDRGSNFELNGAGIRRTGPSGIEKGGNFHRRRPDADRLRESFKKSRRAPSTTSSGTGRGRAGDGGGAEGSGPGHTVGDRIMLGGRGKGADVIRLKVGDITLEREYVVVNWSETKSDPFCLGRTTGLYLADKWRNALQTAMTGVSPGDLLLDTSYRKVVAALRREGKNLSGHSLRRGALHTFLE